MAKSLRSIMSHVKAMLMRNGSSPDEADDLLQEAFVKFACYEQEHTVHEPEAFLVRVAQNLSVDAHRARSRHGEQALIDDLAIVHPGPAIEEILVSREQVRQLSEALTAMDPKTSRIILAHRVEGASYAEIAREHGITVSAVEKQIAKAMLLLEQAMEGCWP